MSAHHGEWEDIRENVLNYDEEGGGEQDQVNAHVRWYLDRQGYWRGGGDTNMAPLELFISLTVKLKCHHPTLQDILKGRDKRI